MLLLATEIVVIAALGSGTKHDPLPGANGMVDFLQADAQSVILREPQSSHDLGNPSFVTTAHRLTMCSLQVVTENTQSSTKTASTPTPQCYDTDLASGAPWVDSGGSAVTLVGALHMATAIRIKA